VPTRLTMVNNIVSNIRNTSAYHLMVIDSAYQANAVLQNNLFYQPSRAVRIQWGATYDVAGLYSATGKCSGCIEADPRFVDAANGNFSLQATSPAIDAGVASSVYALYAQTFGPLLAVDFADSSRPVGAGWDIGAYER
jgi:hypothetical protein